MTIMNRVLRYCLIACFLLAFCGLKLPSVPSTVAFFQSTQIVDIVRWEPLADDFIVVDTTSNMGYLLRSDLSAASVFPVASGQQRNINYLGKRYFGATPSGEWRIKSLDYQVKGYTFGRHGKFLRLYNEDGSTHYGIHTVWDERAIFSLTERYKSLGCVLVRDNVLTVLENVFKASGTSGTRVITLTDITTLPFDLKTIAMETLKNAY
jgi:hypothetical protein